VNVNFAPDSQHVAAQTGDVLLVEGPQVLGALGSGPDKPVVFARNQLVLGVPPNDPGGLLGIAGLATPGLRVAMCAPVQPCGAVAAAALSSAQVTVAAPILVDDTRAALALVEKGQADVALVYRSDTTAAAEKAAAVEFPESSGALAAFQALTLPKAANTAAAQAFISFLGTVDIATVLANAGFQTP
jgi:molybdate transport system substrate-binding protein